MNCFTHSRSTAVGMCVICQKGVCHECVARQTPRLACAACAAPGNVPALPVRFARYEGRTMVWPKRYAAPWNSTGMNAVRGR